MPAAEPDRKLIYEVETAIGPDDADDWSIEPTKFPGQVEESAPGLAGHLRHSSLTETARRYEMLDQQAVDAQSRFKRMLMGATWWLFAAATVSALLAAATVFLPEDATPLSRVVVVTLGVSAALAGVRSAMLIFVVENEGLLKRWMTTRANAEMERLGYFNGVVQRVAESRAKPRVMLEALEFFRRYQLSVQQRYYEGRGAQHDTSSKKTVRMGASAAGLIALSSGLAGIGAAFETSMAALAAVGAVGAALSTAASRREEINQDVRNAERYARTAHSLSKIREGHSDIQTALALGKSEPLFRYVARVQSQISLEHRQWSESEAAAEAFADVKASLPSDPADSGSEPESPADAG